MGLTWSRVAFCKPTAGAAMLIHWALRTEGAASKEKLHLEVQPRYLGKTSAGGQHKRHNARSARSPQESTRENAINLNLS
jgi:DNA-binding transcriptional regulator YdaS (Cro superfamily)